MRMVSSLAGNEVRLQGLAGSNPVSSAMTEEDHLQYHLEVSLTDCGVDGCDWVKGMELHCEARHRWAVQDED